MTTTPTDPVDPLDPPPAPGLDAPTRAALRERVVAGVHPADRAVSGVRRWAVPVVAAVAVGLVALVTGVTLRGVGDDRGSAPAPVQPAGSGTANDPAPGEGTASEATPDPDATPPVIEQAGRGDCLQEARYVLRSATPAAEATTDEGTTTFLTQGGQYAVCTTHDRTTTVLHAGSLDETYGPGSDQALQWSTDYLPGRPPRVAYVAGGPVPEGAEDTFALTYAFPDGHDEAARVVPGDDGRSWWLVEYVPTDGPLVRGNALRLDPVTVTLRLSGVERTYELDFADNQCGQANHGC